ncbi:eliciting plant response-like protein, partial [Amylostereum chailletii]
VTYSNVYDSSSGSLDSVACSNGVNGLDSRFATFKDIPSYPYIGGAFSVTWNSTNCGSCWKLTYPETGVSVNVTIIDAAAQGFNVAQQALDKLTGGQAVELGKASVEALPMPPSACGL